MFLGGMMHQAARAIGALVIAGSVMGASGVGAQELRITQQVSGLETPWALAILPNGDVLVTERDGRLLGKAFLIGEQFEAPRLDTVRQ